MASGQYPPKIPPSGLPKRTFPSFSVRRSGASITPASASASTLNLPRTAFSTTSVIAAVAACPTSPTSSNHTVGSGKSVSFRSLRNLLPFGGSTKSPQSNDVLNTPSRSFSVGFASVRRSINVSREKEEKGKDRNRKFSLSNEALLTSSVISIEPKLHSGTKSTQAPKGGDQSSTLRRSVSFSRLEGEINLEKPLPEPVLPDLSLRDAIEADITLMSLRTPSPPASPEHPPTRYHHPVHSQSMGVSMMNHTTTIAPAELSTIIEADNSGISISKHIPLSPSASPESLSPSTREEEYTIRRQVLQHAASSSSNTTPLMTSSPLQPSSPVQHERFSPHSISIDTGTTPTASIPTSPLTNPFGSNKLGPSNDSEDVDDDNVSEQLSTSQLASQVQAALASTSWGGSSDRAFVIDADTSFIQMHDEDRVRTPSESETSSFADGDDECHLITNMGREGRIVDVDTEKNMNVHDKPGTLETSFESSFLSSPPNREHEDPRSYDEIEDDETSRINNSTLSVINPNYLLRTLDTQEEVSLNLSSLDPDLRDIVRGQIQNQQRQGKSSTSIGSSSGRTMELSSPASVRPSMLQSTVEPGASRSVSSPTTMIPRTSPSFPGLSPHLHNATGLSLSHGPTSVSNSTSALKGIPALAPTTVTMSKRRIASSSFLPRLKPSLPPGSQSFSIPSLETKNSNSSRKTDLPGSGVGAGIDGGNGSKIPQSSTPRIAVFSPIQASINSSSSFSATASIPAITKPGTRRPFGSVGVGAGNPAGGQQQNQQQRSKTTDKNASDGVARVNAVSQVSQVVPEVTVVENSENDLQTTSDLNTKSDSIQDSNLTNIPATIVDIRQERGDAHTWPVTRYDGGEDEDDTRRLTVDRRSQRVTGEESVRLGLPFTSARATTEGIQAPSPLSVHAPLPSHHHQHHSYHRNSCHSVTPITPIAPDPTPTTIRLLVPNPSSSPMLPPQPLLPSPIVPGSSSPSISNGLDQGGSLGANNATQGIVVGANTGEDSGEKMLYGGSSNGRPSRRVPVPLRLSLGGASNTSAGNNGISIHAGPTNRAADGTGLDIPERRPSPLRSTVQFDSRGNNEYFGTSHYHHHHSTDGRTSTRPSIDDSSSVRPLLFMEQNRPLDSPMHSLSHMRRDSPDFTYQKYVVDRERESRPFVRSKDHECDRDKEHQRDGPVVRVRKRSMSVQGNHGCNCAANANTIGNLGAGGLMGGSVINLSSAAMSARERLARARYGDLGGGARPWSSLSMRSAGRTENLLSRDNNHATKSPFYDKEIGPGIDKSVSDRTTAEHGRERSGSTSGIGTLGRYAPLRNASEYNFAHGRRESLVSGSIDSPTFTISTSASGSGSVSGGTTTTTTGGASGSGTGSNRGDTPRSTSTGATSVSTTISNTNKDHERDREDLRELKEKHATETGALLSALSDSQRTSRMLREENTELRERLGGVERDNERLRSVVRELEREVMVVVREREREREKEKTWDTRSTLTGLNNSAGPGVVSASWRGYATPMTKQRDAAMVSRPAIHSNASRLHLLERGLDQGGISDTTMIRRSQRSKLDNILFPKEMESRELESNVYSEGQKRAHNDEGELVMECAIYSNDNVVPDLEDRSFGSTIVPPSSNVNVNTTCTIRRRPSTSSSIFPVPPSNMTMLLHDEMGLPSGLGIEGNQSNVMPGPTKLPGSPSMSISYNSRFPTAIAQSAASNVSVSPTMENLSMVTGSPGSLFLKPEHEMMLDEMESLDLGRNMSSVVVNED